MRKELRRKAPSRRKYHLPPTPEYRSPESVVSSDRRWPFTTRRILRTAGVSTALAIVVFITLATALSVLGHLDYLQQGPWIFGAAAALAAIVSLVVVGYGCRWTGFGEKKFWDWLQLLIVPIFIAVGGYFFTTAQQTYNTAVEDNRAQDAAVQAYMDHIMTLTIDGNLDDQENGEQVRAVLRSRTLTLLNRLGRTRKQYILIFLSESNLISRENAVVDLSYANLRNARLANKNLSHLRLSRTYLNDADLRGADLKNTDLSGADLSDAELSGADLSGADFSDAIVTDDQLNAARSLEGTIVPNGSTYASLTSV